ncbi:hypothetical protein VPH35_090756 [Triticum aestivum]|uniref:uncharacterized protein isoform X2 n=1 Tax=Triticum aestivum TaxID=4565 RepID=UPI001D017203|nr:uncharacterized protein LOC123112337 isoform X2 [Triticum aestivum]
MENKKRRLTRGDEEQRPYKRVARPSALSQLSEQAVSRLSRSVVSLASFDGDTKLRECTGICIETSAPDSEATILTSRQLIPPTWPASLTIKVRLSNNRIVTGRIEDPGIYVDFFIVNIRNVSGVDVASLDGDMQFEPHTKVVAVWRCFNSGLLKSTRGLNLASPSLLTGETIVSTCRIRKAGIGGPLVDFDGNFVGMNSSRTKMEKTAYVRRERILRFLLHKGMVSVKEGVDDATRAKMNSEMKAIWPSLSAKSAARLSESRKGALSKQVLSRLSMSVVALASFDGDTMLRECTGICVESACPDATCFLTSINLIPYTWPRDKIAESLTIKVRLPDHQAVTGWIENPRLYVDYFIVKIKNVDVTGAAHLSHLSLDRAMPFEPYRKVAAVWRYFDSGELKTTGGVDLASLSVHIDEKMLSTWRIHEVGIGGPLVDFDGNFVGMNCSGTKQRKTPYVQRPSIREFMFFRGMVSVKEEVDNAVAKMNSRYGQSYFMPGGGKYINHLDDLFKKDILSKPFKSVCFEMDQSAYSLASESSKRLASKMNQSVVSLASFNGFAKKFSCSGIFIKGKACSATILTSASLVRVPGSAHMIDENLKIEVVLPNGFLVVGILNYYNLHYNVALVDIMGFWRPRTIKISGDPVTSSMDVIAVGSLFAHRKLMAVEGKVLIGKQSELDCIQLCVSTCKITKAGIGGPLIDNDGNFVGMNFYDEEETPFLPRDVINRLLNKKRTSADDTTVEGVENRWLLPGGTHRNTDTIAAVDGNKWPLPEPRRVERRADPKRRRTWPLLRADRLERGNWPPPVRCHVGRRADDHC